ncbi:MAG: MobA/MobL family protein [Rhodobiaceae bacterium]|nr:MobA/MobL family protein [Rhodobiaceae bacterium]
MAIYHCSLKVFSRSNGHSAVAAAAYRSGSQLYDERIGKLHHYSNRSGVLKSFILLPENTSSSYADRAYLWNAAELADNRKNSRTARELVLALPHELCDADRQALTRDMAGWLMERYRVAVDAAIHKPIEKHGDDPRNHHAHILFSTRTLEATGFGAKTRVLDDRKTGAEETELIREVWETLANDALRRGGCSGVSIDRRSLEDQGIDRIPEIHVGTDATHTSEVSDARQASNGSGTHAVSGEAKDHHSHAKEDATDSGSDEEEGDGETDDTATGSGSGESGGLAPSIELNPTDMSEELEHILSDKSNYQYKVNERLSRRDLNTEIKRINAIRAGFSDIPLAEQINDLDQLIGRLDIKLAHFEVLAKHTSLSSLLKGSLGELVKLSVALISQRNDSQALTNLTKEERQQRSTRQLRRYGRTYREGIHIQLKSMRDNIEMLQLKRDGYQRYRGFVDQIDQSLKNHVVSIKVSASNSNIRTLSNQESSLKIYLKAQGERENIPAPFKENSEERLKSPKISSSRDVKHIRNAPSNGINSTNSSETKIPHENIPLSTRGKVINAGSPKTDKITTSSAFKNSVDLCKSEIQTSNPSWRTEPKVGATPFDPIKKEKAQKNNAGPKPKSNDQRSWVTPDNSRMDPLTDAINKKQAKEGNNCVKTPDSERDHDRRTMEGQFNANGEYKGYSRAERASHKAKSSSEAEVSRKRTPPEYRAKPYPSEDDPVSSDSSSNSESLKDKVKSRFAGATGAFKEK